MSDYKKLPANTHVPPTAYHVSGSQVPDFMKRPTRRGGVKPTLEENPAIGDEICQYIRDGMFLREAASMIGIHKATAYDWVSKGRRDRDNGVDSVYAEFYENVERALNEAKHDSITAVRRAGQNPQFWMAAAWYLERRYPQEFGKQDRLQLQHSGGVGTMNVGISAVLKDAESRKALADVVGILASGGIGFDQSNGAGDGDDEWQDEMSTTSGLVEPEFT